jgi:hypothetical protein
LRLEQEAIENLRIQKEADAEKLRLVQEAERERISQEEAIANEQKEAALA